ncbi:ATP-grasp domain-containing protein [Candidatus Berkelbacteria bacterium]|nr:ATP-grasp domain-containing protein [Candidatus Berkelbacteria bacterium]
MANVLAVGDDGRTHAMIDGLRRSKQVNEIHCAPGHHLIPNIHQVGIEPTNIEALARYAKANRIDLTIVGPEAPLFAGIADEFIAQGLPIFGPTKAAARLESSKAFCKQLAKQYQIPTAGFEIFDDPCEARNYVRRQSLPIVIKPDGPAEGKGVTIAETYRQADFAIEEALIDRKFGNASCPIIIEDFLDGRECSIIANTDGEEIILFEAARDYKQLSKTDKRMTGGMGAYSPVAYVSPALMQAAKQEIIDASHAAAA